MLRAALCLGSATLLGAALPARSADRETWRYELTPYLWATAARSEVRNGNGPLVRTDMSPSDLFKTLDFGLMAALEARKGRWAVLLDGMYAKTSDSATVTNLVAGVPVTAGGSANVKLWTLAGAAAYRAVEGKAPVDVIGGLRYNRVDLDADLSASALGIVNLTTSPTFTRHWTDPYVGVRATVPVADRWTLVGYLDAGGFGIGSKNTWQALAGANYRFGNGITAKLGYRYLHTDYDEDGFRYKSDTRGMYIGAGIDF
jgi:opacity protein-like surface antigen